MAGITAGKIAEIITLSHRAFNKRPVAFLLLPANFAFLLGSRRTTRSRYLNRMTQAP